MTKEQVDEFVQKLHAKGWDDEDFQIRTDYSGRGMYGVTTYAIVGCPTMAYDAPGLKAMACDQMGKDDLVWY
jgi:hypothetical protein